MSDPSLDWAFVGLTGAILLLLCVSGFFSGSETALTAVSRGRMHQLEKDGDGRARRVNRLRERSDQLIGAILLGNNLVNILASALLTAAFYGRFGDAGVAYATLLMTALVLIFAEVLPKTYAITNPDRMALAVSGPVTVIVRLFAPLVAGVQGIVRATFAIFGVRLQGEMLSPHEEIRGAIELHHQEGGVESRDREMLGGILDLRELTVEDVMVHRKNMEMIDASEPAAAIVASALDSRHTRLPLWRDDPENIIGVLHAKDLSRAMHAAGGDISQVDAMEIAREPWFVPETTTLPEQLQTFRAKREHFALVVDEYGALMGLVTLEDILEEIVGEIDDEHDQPVQGVREQPDGSVMVDGSVTIRDVNRALDWNLPDEEAVTIAGLVIHEAQTIPERGQVFSFYGRRVEITERQRNQVAQMRITVLPEDAEA
ncbi:MAG: HlyC/CorC family transporter [Caulobacterales bacterium]|nr:HlyC/CorC family transporter [Caulobacterales bacterium]